MNATTSTNPPDPNATVVVGLGEALFDCFDDGRKILGGAPLNFAFHAHQVLSQIAAQGGPRGHATVATRVGADVLGERVTKELTILGMPAQHVQRDPCHPTGTVEVKTSLTENEYTFLANTAWDALEFDSDWESLATRCNAVCFGTLAQRSETSRRAIHEFLAKVSQNANPGPNSATNPQAGLSEEKSSLCVLDVNLRGDFYTTEILQESLAAANIVKLNEEEIEILRNDLQLAPESESPVEIARRMMSKYDLRLVAFTRGAAGTQLITADEVFEGDVPSFPADSQADSVGAGDASCAGMVVGLLIRLSLNKTLTLSNRLGAFVASKAGATPKLSDEMKTWIRELCSD